MSELDEMALSLATIRLARREYRVMDFKDVEKYCIAKRDETLTIFLEMENFIQKNLDIFYNPDDRWVKRAAASNNYGMANDHNRVVAFQNAKGHYYIWIDKGIMFSLNDGNVVYISKMVDKHGEKWNTAFDNFKFHYFPEFDESGERPTDGYTRLSFFPRMANYFPKENPVTFNDWCNLKRRVDEDYQHAIEVRNLLIQAVKEIQEDEQKHLDGIKALKESSKEA
jgi:hypothetical protein